MELLCWHYTEPDGYVFSITYYLRLLNVGLPSHSEMV